MASCKIVVQGTTMVNSCHVHFPAHNRVILTSHVQKPTDRIQKILAKKIPGWGIVLRNKKAAG
jgi:hypothetical protein